MRYLRERGYPAPKWLRAIGVSDPHDGARARAHSSRPRLTRRLDVGSALLRAKEVEIGVVFELRAERRAVLHEAREEDRVGRRDR